ncbi:hypothetical protein KKC88_00380 [Patescibacteria group bacterium]|nr:hypothetical protein [Patescibacteria group bacterium]MBU1672921.1 hypothetical protein [Patescibacteria group bacterium]MBU1963392.1 hypothetical protein [Patescibacteria group bacterium]
MAKVHPKTANWKMFFSAIIIFSLVEAFGVFSAYMLERSIQPTDIFIFLSIFDVLPEIIVGLLIGALILGGLYFLRNKKYILKIFFSLFILVGSSFIFQLYMDFYIAIVLSFFMVILWLSFKKVWVHDIAIGLVICGLGVNFGQIIPIQYILIMIALLSLYDFFAVLKTKVLVKVFSGLASGGLVLAIIIPAKLKNFTRAYDRVDADENFFYLGTGDLLLPLILASAVVSSSPMAAILTAIGAIVGFIALYLYMHIRNIDRAMPALPPIALFSILGFAIGILIG